MVYIGIKSHGGTRPGAGRRHNTHPRQVLIVAGTIPELARIRAALTTRERVEDLLRAIEARVESA